MFDRATLNPFLWGKERSWALDKLDSKTAGIDVCAKHFTMKIRFVSKSTRYLERTAKITRKVRKERETPGWHNAWEILGSTSEECLRPASGTSSNIALPAHTQKVGQVRASRIKVRFRVSVRGRVWVQVRVRIMVRVNTRVRVRLIVRVRFKG